MDKTNFQYYILNINMATSHVSLTELLINVHATMPRSLISCIVREEGRLSFVIIRHDVKVAELWTKQEQYEDDDDGEHNRECNGVWRCFKLADLGSERIGVVFFARAGALYLSSRWRLLRFWISRARSMYQCTSRRKERGM